MLFTAGSRPSQSTLSLLITALGSFFLSCSETTRSRSSLPRALYISFDDMSSTYQATWRHMVSAKLAKTCNHHDIYFVKSHRIVVCFYGGNDILERSLKVSVLTQMDICTDGSPMDFCIKVLVTSKHTCNFN